MIVVKNEDITFFDVDSTLVLPFSSPHGKLIKILDPVTGRDVVQRIHEPMVRLLKEADKRGSWVVVWSRGGWEWARNVVEALNLQKEVDQVVSKPLTYFDDKDIREWLPHRVYIEPGTDYKNIIK
jgi:hypothetical protein